jgi:hypothetical protein
MVMSGASDVSIKSIDFKFRTQLNQIYIFDSGRGAVNATLITGISPFPPA